MENKKKLNEIPDDAMRAVSGGYTPNTLARGTYVTVKDSYGHLRRGEIVGSGEQSSGGITRPFYYVEFKDGRLPKTAQVFLNQIRLVA